MNNKTKWQDYEQLTAYIYHQIGKLDGTKILGYGANCKVEGKSGVRHQFDVLVGVNNDDIEKIGVECKYWDKKVNEDIVSVVCSHIDDCDIKLGVIVSVKGFTNDAIKMAKFRGIELVILKDIELSDFDGMNRILTIQVSPTFITPHFSVINKIKTKQSHEIGKYIPYNSNQKIFYANGEEQNFIDYVTKKANSIITTRTNNKIKVMEKEFLFPENTFISSNGNDRIQLDSLVMKLYNIKFDTYKDSFEISLIDVYKKIFHILFSDKKYILYNNGKVELLD